MELMMYLVLGIAVGAAIGYFMSKAGSNATQQNDLRKLNEAELDYRELKTRTSVQIQMAEQALQQQKEENKLLQAELQAQRQNQRMVHDDLSTVTANLHATKQTFAEKTADLERSKKELELLRQDLDFANQRLATAYAENNALNEKRETQKVEMENLGAKFNLEFRNMANEILETKTATFTELNKTNLNLILEPLGRNIAEFKNKVEEVYIKEAQERFSLGNEVSKLAELNRIISDEARNLTKALKGEAKTQGRWGEMILESILERSGLVKGREYFMEHELRDADGIALRSDLAGKKMRPDAVIKYPDNRNVIIDSKVSLNAFTRLIAAVDVDEQKAELNAHISAIKSHIISLSAKGYDDYDKSLDFVMLFVPSEPAYIAALQGDPDLWNFAYDKKILLLSPTNLITSLKLIVDLWKREYQNQNTLEIAERGAKLYDKFYAFVSNLKDVGTHMEKAQFKYGEAFKQLSVGNDNLVLQATKLKELGLKTKKNLPDLGLPGALEEDKLIGGE
ncbi:MAG TPA: DNA recombination protein RmuC [Dyadobacter sp.]|nr:DNA recombination protein RmuC [Dyadobacter sp.]